MRKLLVGFGLMIGVAGLAAPPALAGGWATSTLDPVEAPVAGQETAIGFTILQHGQTPVEVEGAAIAVTSPSGQVTVFPARPEGATGHYVAMVVFEEGQSTWEIHQGFFAPQPLGAIQVGGSSVESAPTAVESSTYRWPSGARALLPVAAIVLAGIAIVDAVASRRRKARIDQ